MGKKVIKSVDDLRNMYKAKFGTDGRPVDKTATMAPTTGSSAPAKKPVKKGQAVPGAMKSKMAY